MIYLSIKRISALIFAFFKTSLQFSFLVGFTALFMGFFSKLLAEIINSKKTCNAGSNLRIKDNDISISRRFSQKQLPQKKSNQ